MTSDTLQIPDISGLMAGTSTTSAALKYQRNFNGKLLNQAYFVSLIDCNIFIDDHTDQTN